MDRQILPDPAAFAATQYENFRNFPESQAADVA
jgi:hypothetical protein